MITPPDTATKTLDDLLHQALVQGASDVHFESGEDFSVHDFASMGCYASQQCPHCLCEML